MPQAVVIDLGTNFTFGNQLPIDPLAGTVDILFAPSGSVVGRAQTGGSIVLWVRDATQDTPPDPVPGYPPNDPNHLLGTAPFGGQPTLISLYTRTGFIAAHPVDPRPRPLTTPPTPPDPYFYTKDGRSSGL
jgi:hypothetical protein